jgi:esterase/lipase/1-acyl-sn-glycerol-3-phosphate acyltransferase
MPSTFSLSLTKWVLDVIAKAAVKADARLHNAEVIRDDMAIIFTVNHFTRLETILLPYIIYKHTGREVMGLAAAELFKGRVGEFLKSNGTISVADPDRDKIIVNSLLRGVQPWMIFPEGAMIKDKKVIDHEGEFRVYSNGKRRPPHTGAAVLALRAEFYRHKIKCLYDRPGREGLQGALDKFALQSAEDTLSKRTVIIPVNITYFPMRAHENGMLRLAQRLREDLSPRAMEELAVEGTVLSEKTNVDITLGDPIDVGAYLQAPEYAEMMACGLNDLELLEMDNFSHFNYAARKLMLRYMKDIYHHTTINYDHVFATLLRHMPARSFSDRGFRNRVFQVARKIPDLGYPRVHSLLAETHRDLVFEEASNKLDDFMALCLKEGVLTREGDTYTKRFEGVRGESDFHLARWNELTEVIANEVEPLDKFTDLAKRVARQSRSAVSRAIRDHFLEQDLQFFEDDYAKFYNPEQSKGPEVGRPFLLKPVRVKGGVILSHGYMAAPMEVRALAESFYQRGYAVYGVRLRGHGTAPEDLADRQWTEWYESFNRGYAVIKSLTDNIVLGGFSTGGCMALMAAARKGIRAQAVFSICAPLSVRNYSIRLAPSVVTLNSLLKKIGQGREGWEFVVNEPENKHINYTRNPLTGVKQLIAVMDATERLLPQVTIPAFILQASKDPIVNPDSARQIFDKIASPYKELVVLERARHGIINGEGSADVHHYVHQFLERAPRHAIIAAEQPAAETEAPLPAEPATAQAG